MSEPWTEREPSSFVPNPRLPLFPMFGEARCSPNPVQHPIYFFPGWESPRLPCCTARSRTAAVFDTLSLPSWLGCFDSPLLRHGSEPQLCSTLFPILPTWDNPTTWFLRSDRVTTFPSHCLLELRNIPRPPNIHSSPVGMVNLRPS